MISRFRAFLGGVERHLSDLTDELVRRDHDVKLFSSEDVEADGGHVFSASASGSDRFRSAGDLLWNSRARKLLRGLAQEFEPDVVHIHSIYHQLSPAVLGVVEAPTVMTLHEYKLSAPCYTLYRDGGICQACVGSKFATSAIRYRCIRGSRAASVLCATEDLIYRRRYRSEVQRFIVPSHFAADVAVRSGLSPADISVIPWGVAAFDDFTCPEQPRDRIAFFGGRLHPTKGIQPLLEAWRSMPAGHGCTLRIAGEGELKQLVNKLAADDDSVHYLGLLSQDAMERELRSAAVSVVPSLFPETMGLSAVESLSVGTPLISSGRGALADLSGPGVWTLPQADVSSIRVALIRLLIEGEARQYRRDLATRDVSAYRFDRMVDAIEAEYRRTTDEYRGAPTTG